MPYLNSGKKLHTEHAEDEENEGEQGEEVEQRREEQPYSPQERLQIVEQLVATLGAAAEA
jgi:hypothetical protein